VVAAAATDDMSSTIHNDMAQDDEIVTGLTTGGDVENG
jgi:hypothetical protein